MNYDDLKPVERQLIDAFRTLSQSKKTSLMASTSQLMAWVEAWLKKHGPTVKIAIDIIIALCELIRKMYMGF